jgi:hypothetical protein
MLCGVDHTTIDRAARDLSNGVRFTHKRCCDVIYRSIHITVVCSQGFKGFEVLFCYFGCDQLYNNG